MSSGGEQHVVHPKAATAATATTTTTNAETAPPPLPLGWTRVKRQRAAAAPSPQQQQQDENDATATATASSKKSKGRAPATQEERDWLACCTDQNCRRRQGRAGGLFLPNSTGNNCVAVDPEKTTRKIAGTAIWCLPDPDCDWFQGYLFVQNEYGRNQHANSSNNDSNEKNIDAGDKDDDSAAARPASAQPPPLSTAGRRQLGLLGRVQEIDECLQCAEGGYREITLQVTEFGGGNNSSSNKMLFENIEWTGGDMMRLRTALDVSLLSNNNSSNENGNESNAVNVNKTSAAAAAVPPAPARRPIKTVAMDADRVWTGAAAVARIETLFGSLLRRLRNEGDDGDGDGNCSVEELMPQAAIVVGRMELCLPTTNQENEK